MESTFYDSSLFTYVILPALIFLSRIFDVTIGTLRIVMVSKGQKVWAPFLGFFEVLIWLIAISKIFQNLDNWVCYVTYAGGFATGNYIGLILEEKLAVGIVKIQIITRKKASKLIRNLTEAGYGITHHAAQGSTEEVSIIYSIIETAKANGWEPKAYLQTLFELYPQAKTEDQRRQLLPMGGSTVALHRCPSVRLQVSTKG